MGGDSSTRPHRSKCVCRSLTVMFDSERPTKGGISYHSELHTSFCPLISSVNCAAGVPISYTLDTPDVGWSGWVWWSHSTWGGGGLAGSVPTFMTHPTTWRGAVGRLPLMWVEYSLCVLAVWSSWAGHWCVCSPHRTHTSSTTLNRSTQKYLTRLLL